ncbi:acetyl-CoA carboxylase biotin carboxyl carrier protein [Dactylococcopsis salina]|uniref:Biotin carboxyl carrier protein of acetyl-CoA carboxylase n=1 Tax=Dactylococcopsis salina (strain PCC 8305) TaxID=13035 RepID=K9YU28_DACS8|nr:acetyl-CoA carboxylase biotin carboxyl carrier protein [Dactylococcopsis salina]AFZ50399.1 acetyl-CoA carboxylase, biotin carboxyl carrier protein [Dactylococcopsis salina PCC 8305]
MSIDFKAIRELLNDISEADITEFSLKSDQFELTVRKGLTTTATETSVSPPSPQTSPPPSEASSPPEDKKPEIDKSEWEEITSPIVGTFYEAPAPEEPVFVKVGDQIQTNQTVCIVEAMKIMNEIEAEVSGKVMEITVKNGEPVEYGQTLMRVKPD